MNNTCATGLNCRAIPIAFNCRPCIGYELLSIECRMHIHSNADDDDDDMIDKSFSTSLAVGVLCVWKSCVAPVIDRSYWMHRPPLRLAQQYQYQSMKMLQSSNEVSAFGWELIDAINCMRCVEHWYVNWNKLRNQFPYKYEGMELGHILYHTLH